MGTTIGALYVRRSAFVQATPERVWEEFASFDRLRAWFGIGHTLHAYEPRLGGHVELSVDCSNAPDVNGDVAMLRQAFLNLALNACQAMPNGGILRIHCQSARDRRVNVEFSDTGLGINPEHLQRIFDLYYTTKEKGSGIGLSMVYRTVQMHDGEIEVQSTPGSGTTFRVLLPQA